MDTLFLIIFVNIIVVLFLFLSFLRKLYWKNTMDWMLLNEFYHRNHFIPNSFLFLWSSHMNLSITQPCTYFQSILFCLFFITYHEHNQSSYCSYDNKIWFDPWLHHHHLSNTIPWLFPILILPFSKLITNQVICILTDHEPLWIPVTHYLTKLRLGIIIFQNDIFICPYSNLSNSFHSTSFFQHSYHHIHNHYIR